MLIIFTFHMNNTSFLKFLQNALFLKSIFFKDQTNNNNKIESFASVICLTNNTSCSITNNNTMKNGDSILKLKKMKATLFEYFTKYSVSRKVVIFFKYNSSQKCFHHLRRKDFLKHQWQQTVAYRQRLVEKWNEAKKKNKNKAEKFPGNELYLRRMIQNTFLLKNQSFSDQAIFFDNISTMDCSYFLIAVNFRDHEYWQYESYGLGVVEHTLAIILSKMYSLNDDCIRIIIGMLFDNFEKQSFVLFRMKVSQLTTKDTNESKEDSTGSGSVTMAEPFQRLYLPYQVGLRWSPLKFYDQPIRYWVKNSLYLDWYSSSNLICSIYTYLLLISGTFFDFDTLPHHFF
ncbi:hypothetical protein RFI_02091 [Reticulomyxa filosa]|uniref:Uncharacterized protein n=1 Tax=Reticulomyxa filosa TaxID=46433 RepID=X6P8Y1_RETFI|nr:hypothetical protein RFI_02091 [Reticulomyxa filosa]|eukprot:ETO34980.1 hypothetical protein RFI_02091 [Reticulomyxa filosa]